MRFLILTVLCSLAALAWAMDAPEVRWLGHPVAVPVEDCAADATECVPGIYSTVEIGLLDDGTVVWRILEVEESGDPLPYVEGPAEYGR